MLVVLNSTLGSSLPAGVTPFYLSVFSLSADNSVQLTLPVTTYLIGYVVAPLAFGPLSEAYGRRPVMVYTFFGYIIWAMACPLSPNYAALNIFRFLAGVCAAAPITVVGGLYADIFRDPVIRGRAMALFMASTAFGPTVVAALISGYLAPISWKLPFWTALAIAGATIPPLIMMPETYGPIILVRRARSLRKANPDLDPQPVAALEVEAGNIRDIVSRVITRPVRMFFTERMVLFTCLYTALIYAIFYLFFEAYPIIFQDMYKLSSGDSALAFMPIGIGSLLSFPVFVAYDAFLRRAQRLDQPWSRKHEAFRLPLSFIGGPLISAAIFWLSFTAVPSLSPFIPALAGLPYGIGFVLIFMSLLNYLSDAYEIYAASAYAAASCTRSLLGALLPLAAGRMYDALGIKGAGGLLGGLSVTCLVIPVGFWFWGESMRRQSPFASEISARRDWEASEREKANEDRNGDEGGEGVDVEKGEGEGDGCGSYSGGGSNVEEEGRRTKLDTSLDIEK